MASKEEADRFHLAEPPVTLLNPWDQSCLPRATAGDLWEQVNETLVSNSDGSHMLILAASYRSSGTSESWDSLFRGPHKEGARTGRSLQGLLKFGGPGSWRARLL